MSRKLKRVPLDFEWPINQDWIGFVNPFGNRCKTCPFCEHGYSTMGQHLKNQWYGYAAFKPEDRGSKPFRPTDEVVHAFAERQTIRSPEYYGTRPSDITWEAVRLCRLWNKMWMHHINASDIEALLATDRLMEFTHTCGAQGWVKSVPAKIPTPEEVNVWSLGGLGHDSINASVVIQAECERLKMPYTCFHCDGRGSVWESKEIEAHYDAWKAYGPPTGEGCQLWEEHAPLSPVFASFEELARWAETNTTVFGSTTATAAQWKQMFEDGDIYLKTDHGVFL